MPYISIESGKEGMTNMHNLGENMAWLLKSLTYDSEKYP